MGGEHQSRGSCKEVNGFSRAQQAAHPGGTSEDAAGKESDGLDRTDREGRTDSWISGLFTGFPVGCLPNTHGWLCHGKSRLLSFWLCGELGAFGQAGNWPWGFGAQRGYRSWRCRCQRGLSVVLARALGVGGGAARHAETENTGCLGQNPLNR